MAAGLDSLIAALLETPSRRVAGRRGALLALALLPACATAQNTDSVRQELRARAAAMPSLDSTAGSVAVPRPPAPRFRSRADSLHWSIAKRLADRSTGYRIVISLEDRALWVLVGHDTLRNAPVAVGAGSTLDYAGREWTFETPRGRRTILRKEAEPKWIPPEWHYFETARNYGLRVAYLPPHRAIRLNDGRKLVVRDSLAGVIDDGEFEPLPIDEEVVFDSTLFIPPLATHNRLVPSELGKYRLAIGDGYYLHGTPDLASIGTASTHGCIRLLDDDIEWLYDNVRVGTKVYIY